ncbi:MAG: shikimate dehydrogenase [Kofleriaceae bacterium]
MIRGTTRLAAVIGWPVEHSRSPQLLNAAFAAAGLDAVLVPIGVAPESLATVITALHAAGALGASITLPHKLAVIAACHQRTPAAEAIGAVNCLHFTSTGIVGHNTDCDGFVDGLAAAGLADPRHVVVLGAGGAARAVAYGLRSAQTIEVIARRPAEVTWTQPRVIATAWTIAALEQAFARADLVVDCTPIGLDPSTEATVGAAIPLQALPATAWVAGLVYHRPTLLLERARAAGLRTVDGKAMLVHQGARAFTIWTGLPAPLAAMTIALDDALRSGT